MRLDHRSPHRRGFHRSSALAVPVALLTLLLATPQPSLRAAPALGPADPRIEAMKTGARGPFRRIRWFCNDGTVLPPGAGACDPHGGGSQHGEWSAVTTALRGEGFAIANVYADLDIEALLSSNGAHDTLGQMAIERFLMRIDDGWILRRARRYRGALQEEDERAGARALLIAMAERTAWTGPRYLAWRTLAGLLPHGNETASAAAVRQQASAIAAGDPSFTALRNKIHVAPGPEDAAAVRAHGRGANVDTDALTALAEAIEALYDIDPTARITALADALAPAYPTLAAELEGLGAAGPSAAARVAATASALAALRRALRAGDSTARHLELLAASRTLESLHFSAAAEMDIAVIENRRSLLELLADHARALFGVGLLSSRQLEALDSTFRTLARESLPLTTYRREIDYLARVPDWGEARARFNFGIAHKALAQIEPLAVLFTQDLLRGSPLFFYAAVIDRLARDADALAGVEHRLLGATIATGLRALNPGLARGVLRDGRGLAAEDFARDGIYLLAETTAELPPVAGIITAGAGNPLSHVQLLARNLGIPNVAVSSERLAALRGALGERVLLAVSEGGAVHLEADEARFDDLFERDDKPRMLIEPDLDKLDLSRREIVPLDALRADDSGRTVGPKAAKLGELKAHFPEAVAAGVAIPFGVFRDLLEGPAPDGSGTMFEAMVTRYRALESLPTESAREQASEALRAEVYDWIADREVPAPVATALEAWLATHVNNKGQYGVFVRSDTNVEDLPGFTGAGLNLTVANAVGIEAILEAIPRVWASPFTPRAYAWRQSLMRLPEHVYPAVLLLESVDADKSGVLVTQDLDTGDPAWLSVAVNEGVGGAVDGQSAETLRIHLDSGDVRLLAQASAALRRQVDPAGGVRKLPASGADSVLDADEIRQLADLARSLASRFPGIVDDHGQPLPADVEFGFEGGALRLFQIRPFVDNAEARANAYLVAMDPKAEDLAQQQVVLDDAPL